MTNTSGLTQDQKAKQAFDQAYQQSGLGGANFIQNTTSAVTGAVGNLQTIGNNLTRPTFWARIGIGALGLLFIWWAILFALASNKTVQKVAKTALKSNPYTAAPAAIAESALGS